MAAPLRTWTVYRRLLQQARPFWGHISLLLTLSLIATPLKLLAPLPLKIVVDHVIGEEAMPRWLARLVPQSVAQASLGLLILAAALLVVVSLLTYLNALMIWLLHSYTGERLVLAFRSRLLRHVHRLSLSYHDTRGTSDSLYRIQYDAPAIQWIAIDGIIPFIGAMFTLAGMIYVTATIDVQLALVALTVCPVLLVLTKLWSRRLRQQWDHAKKMESSAMSVVQETLIAMRLVKAFNQEERQHDHFMDRATLGMLGNLRVARSQGTFDLLIGVTLAAGSAAVLFLGVRNVMAGSLSLGQLLLIWAYVAQLYGPVQMISNKTATLQKSMASAQRAFELLDQKVELVEKPDAQPIERCRGSVAFEKVGFEYEPGRPVLQDISFQVEPGQRVGLVGRTGAGKSTLMNMLIRFYDPTHGRVLLDGVDLRDYRLDDVRNQFTIVLQEPLLLATSIGENIAYAKPEASQEEIERAAQAAGAHDFISRLPEGYDTLVGERGMKLSGGERQRISLARAFLKDAPILILDEPTSAVDTRTEAQIMEAMDRLMLGRTTFMIAHRLSTLRSCDMLLVLEAGRLVRAGSQVQAMLDELEQVPAKPADVVAIRPS